MPQPDLTVGDDPFDRLCRDEYEPMVALAYLLLGTRHAAEDVEVPEGVDPHAPRG